MTGNEYDPRERRDDPGAPQETDPASGTSDDPRVDPTPDRRHSDTEEATRDQ